MQLFDNTYAFTEAAVVVVVAALSDDGSTNTQSFYINKSEFELIMMITGK